MRLKLVTPRSRVLCCSHRASQAPLNVLSLLGEAFCRLRGHVILLPLVLPVIIVIIANCLFGNFNCCLFIPLVWRERDSVIVLFFPLYPEDPLVRILYFK